MKGLHYKLRNLMPELYYKMEGKREKERKRTNTIEEGRDAV